MNHQAYKSLNCTKRDPRIYIIIYVYWIVFAKSHPITVALIFVLKLIDLHIFIDTLTSLHRADFIMWMRFVFDSPTVITFCIISTRSRTLSSWKVSSNCCSRWRTSASLSCLSSQRSSRRARPPSKSWMTWWRIVSKQRSNFIVNVCSVGMVYRLALWFTMQFTFPAPHTDLTCFFSIFFKRNAWNYYMYLYNMYMHTLITQHTYNASTFFIINDNDFII